MKIRRIFSIVLLIVLGLLVSCNNEEISYDEPFINLKQNEVTLKIGEEYKLEIETNIDDDLSYSSSNSDVARCIKHGYVKGVNAGEAIISVEYDDIKSTMKVIVSNEKVKYEKSEYQYWINLIKDKIDVNSPIMTTSEIEDFNKNLYDNSDIVDVNDLTGLDKIASGDFVKNCINSYSNIDKYPIYKSDGTKISNDEKAEILLNRNIDAIEDQINVGFGVIVSFCSIRSYPTNYYSNSSDIDRFQEDGIDVGEVVLIYHYSKDGKWAFIQCENYIGWIEKDNLAKCTEEEFLKYYRSDKYMVVLAEHIDIEGVRLRMGDKLPYKEIKNNEFIVYFPKKCGDESLCIEEVNISKNELVSDGYIQYNYLNLFSQGFKLLNTAYRWGDYKVDGRDCSSTMNAIFKCFGFVMPRNTSRQRSIPGYSTVVSGLDDSSIKNYQIGTMIFTSSHVMMYIGEDEYGTSYLLHNSGYCHLQSLADYGGSKMIATLTIDR